tara:strand:- start:950 stop:1228 length:279 start_codon:yes stop_codon:yes gene_type:complete
MKNNLRKYRNKVDNIDNKIFVLIKKRTKVVNNMLALKKFKKDIIDQKRIKEILKKIKSKSIQNGIDPKITNKVWKSIIWSYVDFQKRNFKKR